MNWLRKMVENPLWQILNSSILIFLIGLGCTLGVINDLNQKNQRETNERTEANEKAQWKRDKRIEVFHDELVKSRELVDEVSTAIKQKYYYTYLVLTYSGNSENFKDLKAKYDEACARFGTNAQLYRDSILLYIGNEDIAYRLIDRSNNGQDNASLYHLYYTFGKDIDKKISSVSRGKRFVISQELSDRIKDLGKQSDDYILSLNKALKNKNDRYLSEVDG